MSTSTPNPPDASALAAILSEAVNAEQAAANAAQAHNGLFNDPWVREKMRDYRDVCRAILGRQTEALKLYCPLPMAERFHRSTARIRLAVGSNRSSKSTAALVEVARAVTGQNPYPRYPLKDGRAFLVGRDERHLGQVLYRKLFKEAASFRVIRDEHTKKWRPWIPDQPYDAAYKEQCRWAPPLIPERFVKDVSWTSKKDDIPRMVKLHNSWEMSFLASGGQPPAGSDVDFVLFDEEIWHSAWLPEMLARIIDRRGAFVWSCTPQEGTQQLHDLHLRGQEEIGTAKPHVEEFRFLIRDNIYLSEEDKQNFYADMQSPEDYRVRVEGEYSLLGALVFPEWHDTVFVDHFAIPQNWTLYYAVDPGRQACAVIFGAVPTPQWIKKNPGKPELYIWDELYIKQCTARLFAKGVKSKLGRRKPLAAIIDTQESRKHDTGSGLNIEWQYSKWLRKLKISARATGFGFMAGCTDPKARIEAGREWLGADEHGNRRIGVFRRCVNLDREMKSYQYEVRRIAGQAKVITDKPVKRNDHAVDCLLYLLAAGPVWRAIPKPKETMTKAQEARIKLNRWIEARLPGGKPSQRSVNLGPKG